MSDQLTAGGILLEILGLSLAIVGINDTWSEFATPTEPITAPLRRLMGSAASRAARQLATWRDRLLRRPRHVHVVTGSARLTIDGGRLRVRARLGYPELPRVPADWIVTDLDRRTRELADRIADVRDRLEDEIEVVRSDAQSRADQQHDAVERVEGLAKRVATGGLRLQLIGLGLVGGGLVLQLFGVIVD